MNNRTTLPTVGFLGTGAIAEAIVRGLRSADGPQHPIVVSKRSASRAHALSTSLAGVRVAPSNAALCEAADLLFVAVLPGQAEEVLRSLELRAGQKILSLVGGLDTDAVRACVGPGPEIRRLIPMPPIELGVGPIPLFPGDAEVTALLAPCGRVLELEDERHFDSFVASSAAMATFYEILGATSRWTREQGVPPEQAAAYTTELFAALAHATTSLSPTALDRLADGCLTRGGLNEQVLTRLRDAGWFERFVEEIQSIADRVAGTNRSLDGQNLRRPTSSS